MLFNVMLDLDKLARCGWEEAEKNLAESQASVVVLLGWGGRFSDVLVEGPTRIGYDFGRGVVIDDSQPGVNYPTNPCWLSIIAPYVIKVTGVALYGPGQGVRCAERLILGHAEARIRHEVVDGNLFMRCICTILAVVSGHCKT